MSVPMPSRVAKILIRGRRSDAAARSLRAAPATARSRSTDGLVALKKADATGALQLAEKAETLNPGFYQNSFLQGRALLALGRRDEAAQAFEKALSEQPAFLKETQQLEELLREAKMAN